MKPLFISIPHSGERIPPETDWLQGLPELVVMCDVDRFVDRLYQPALDALKIGCVKTQWNRYVVDLNRLPEDVDRDSVAGNINPSGQFPMGLHWLRTTRGSRLLPEPMSLQLHQQLVNRYFKPFHANITDMYSFFRERGAKSIYHIDAHSMPSRGTSSHRDPGQLRAEIVVSDSEGKSCSTEFKELVVSSFTMSGLKVAYNWPYFGGRVTQTYGKPHEGQHALQVEINRALYMDEETKQWIPDLGQALSAKLAIAVRMIYDQLPKG